MCSDMRKPEVFIIDDESNFSESLQIALADRFSVSVAGSLKRARELLKARVPDAILLDLRLPDGNGIEFLQELKNDIASMPVVILMTAFATVDNAVRALKEGAVDYFTKPMDIEKLKRELSVYIENRLLHEKVSALDREINTISPPFVTSGTGKMKDIVEKVPMVSHLDIPVLISGETGTGKERLAKWIHTLSGAQGEMVVINCAALPKDILESELFGYTKGAFSGAAGYKEGLIERAGGGTLFLDEIGELPEDIQAKFLRVIEDGVYYKLGDSTEHRVKFRLISATNRDLLGPASSFRKDLYYRINGIAFELPPLRQRKEDIPLLISAFIHEANFAFSKDVKGISTHAMQCLIDAPWPGNIRELKWCISRAVAVAAVETLDRDAFPADSDVCTGGQPGVEYAVPMEEAISRLEKQYIQNALALANNSKTEAALALGISVRALHYKLKKYNL